MLQRLQGKSITLLHAKKTILSCNTLVNGIHSLTETEIFAHTHKHKYTITLQNIRSCNCSAIQYALHANPSCKPTTSTHSFRPLYGTFFMLILRSINYISSIVRLQCGASVNQLVPPKNAIIYLLKINQKYDTFISCNNGWLPIFITYTIVAEICFTLFESLSLHTPSLSIKHSL